MKNTKTTSVKALIISINYNLARTDNRATVDYKMALCMVLESILMDTGNYQGFGFIDNNDSETGSMGYYSRFYYINGRL